MITKIKNWIAGKYVAPINEEYFKNLNPADQDDVVGLFPVSGRVDIDHAVSAAQEAFPIWSEMPAPKRGDLIFKAADRLTEKKEDLARIIVREMGKTMAEALGDIQSSIDVARFMAGEGRRLYGQTTFSALARRWALTKRTPVGICGLITAWNAPMAIVTWKLFPALICGNAVVVKPSEDAPMTAHVLGEILNEVGFPNGVVNLVYGVGEETGKALVSHPDVNLISFTGSTRVGQMISEECGRQLKRCSLEMGGKNGLIVLDDADIPAAVNAVAAGAFSSAGQRCAATSRVFVHAKVYDDFLEGLIQETKSMKVGKGDDPLTRVCPVINRKQYSRILSAIDEAAANGARCVCGGRALTSGEYAKGNYIEPTIFTEVDIHSELARSEIFGPVLAVFKIQSLEEAVEQMNTSGYGLSASVFTANINAAMWALEKIQAGCCYVNAPTFGSEPHMPFGGVKLSGNGSREPGTQALDVFSEWKTIYMDYSGLAQNSQYRIK